MLLEANVPRAVPVAETPEMEIATVSLSSGESDEKLMEGDGDGVGGGGEGSGVCGRGGKSCASKGVEEVGVGISGASATRGQSAHSLTAAPVARETVQRPRRNIHVFRRRRLIPPFYPGVELSENLV